MVTALAFDHVACQWSVDWWGVWPGSSLIKGQIVRQGEKRTVANQCFQLVESEDNGYSLSFGLCLAGFNSFS